MGNLIKHTIDLNDPKVVKKLRKVISELVQNRSCYQQLKFKPKYYFYVPSGQIPVESGWYIILHGKNPLYVGCAIDLNKRLNTTNGSLDNFAKEGRSSDPVRNFIKKFADLQILPVLRVCVIKAKDVCSKLKVKPNTLNRLDKRNIEKVISIFRCFFKYRAKRHLR
jgi:hypothetical protein